MPGRIAHMGKTLATLKLTLPFEVETVDDEQPVIYNAVTDDLRCTVCGDSVRIDIEPVVFPKWQSDVAVAMERFTGRKQVMSKLVSVSR